MRVLVGLTEVAGYYRGLKLGFEALGVDVRFINLQPHPFGFGGHDPNLLVSAYQRLRGRPSARVPRYALFAWAAARFDLFIFGFNSSFLGGYRDLPILKRLGKKIIYQFHGSDSRPPYLDGSRMAKDRGLSIADGIAQTKSTKRTLATIERHADAIVNIPPQAHLHERPYVNWLRVGLSCQPRWFPARVEFPDNRPLRALHSPSHPEAKGSDQIRAIVEKLAREGIPLELVEMRGRSNREVLDELARCDFVIDQLYADYAMPGFATEAAWFGRAVIIGGYAKPLWDRLLPEAWRPPSLYVAPEALEDAVRRVATDAAYRRALGAAGREFVESKWSPKQIAQRYLDLAAGPPPADWIIDPRDNDYWQGCCAPEDRVKALIGRFVAEGGREALCLGDKPALERRLLDAAGLA